MHRLHKEILTQIKEHSGKPTQHTFLDAYLGNKNLRYPINMPTLRLLAKTWMHERKELTTPLLVELLSSLSKGKSSTEKSMVGILLDYATPTQRKFDIKFFDQWLDELTGWAEIDVVCTGKYAAAEIPSNWRQWRPRLLQFSKSKNINKRRAALVLFCAPLRNSPQPDLLPTAFTIIDTLKGEKEVLLTKAISWVLRTMEKHHRKALENYLDENIVTLPKIAIRETTTKLLHGKKTVRLL